MTYLLDTNILVRLADAADPQHAAAWRAVVKLRRQRHTLCLTPQVLIEFRATATRPVANNGLGLLPADAELLAAKFEAGFSFLTETPDIFPAWKGLVGTLGIVGKQVHDARLVAVCHVHAVTHLMTFNVGDFARMAAHGPGVTIVDPVTV